MADLRAISEDPAVRVLGMMTSYFLRLFTKYVAQCTDAAPDWFINLLTSDEIPVELQLQTFMFLFGRRPDLENQIRHETDFKNIIEKNSKRHLIDTVVMDVLATVLEESRETDTFSYWFPRGGEFGRHVVIASNGPDKNTRISAVACISACGHYRQAIAYFRDVSEFTNLRRGPGCFDVRSTACARFAKHDEFSTAFGEELRDVWRGTRTESHFEDPGVVIESMQM